jgi:putative tributyrin esterase
MSCLRYYFHSAVLNCDTDITVTIPDLTMSMRDKPLNEIYNPERRFPTLYLCHGGGEDSTAWLRYSQVELYAQQAGIMTVSFDSSESFCCDMKRGRKYFTFASEELPLLVQSHFPSSSSREDNFVAGFSMGGHSAMKLALRCPEKYSAIASLSGAKDMVKMHAYVKNVLKFNASFDLVEDAFGAIDETLYGTENDLLYLARTLAESDRPKPLIMLACGTEDYGYVFAREYKEYLDKVGLANTFYDYPGCRHDYEYANQAMRRFITEMLPVRK